MTKPSQHQLLTFRDQADFARALAGRWSADGHAAEDLVQDALVVALEQSEIEERQSRGWWGQLLKNLGRTRWRRESRRQWREHAAAHARSEPAAREAELAASDRLQLLAAIDDLPVVYRDAIRLRYLEGHSARSAARLLGCPESTLCTRTAEALRRLRLAIGKDQEPGRVSWLAAVLFPFRTRQQPLGSAAPARTLLMGNSIKLVVTVGLVLGLFYAVNETRDPNLPSLALAEDATLERDRGQLDLVPPGAEVLDGLRVAGSSGDEPETTSSLSGFVHPPYPKMVRTPLTVNGRVLDLSGQIVAGIEVHVSMEGAPALKNGEPADKRLHTTTDAQGNFELAAMAPARLSVKHPRFATVYGVNLFKRKQPEPVLLVVAPRVELAGVVVNEAGALVEAARISIEIPTRLFDLPGEELLHSNLIPRSAPTDERGRFRFPEIADLPESRLHVAAPGYRALSMDFPVGGDGNLRLVLERAQPGPEMITGTVQFQDGKPAVDAWVSAGNQSVQSDALGFFAIDLAPGGHSHEEQPGEVLRVHGVLPGYLPAQADVPSITQSSQAGERKPLLLVLGGPCLSIHGQVLDEQGEPLANLAIRVVEATPFGSVPSAEHGWWTRNSVEEMMGGGQSRSDHRGEFELEGLLDREYSIEVLQRPSLMSMTSPALAAGSRDVKLVLDLSAAQPIAGVVLDRHGEPVAGVTVSVSRHWPGSLEIGAQSVSIETGRFHIERSTPQPAFLRIEGDAVVTDLFYELPEDADLQALEVLVARRCAIQFDFGDWQERADALQALDAFGKPVDMMYQQNNTVGVRPRVQLGRGYSDVFAISDRVSHIAVLRGEKELARFPVLLMPGETLLLRL